MNGTRGRPPLISTYAVGAVDGRRPQAAGRLDNRRTHSVLAAVGTASAVAIVAIGGTLHYVTKPAPPSLISERGKTLQQQGYRSQAQILPSYASDNVDAVTVAAVDTRATRVRPDADVNERAAKVTSPNRRRTGSVEDAKISVPEAPMPHSGGSEAAFPELSVNVLVAIANQDAEAAGSGGIASLGTAADKILASAGSEAISGSAQHGSMSEPQVSPSNISAPALPSAPQPARFLSSGELFPPVDRLTQLDDSASDELIDALSAEAVSAAVPERADDPQLASKAAEFAEGHDQPEPEADLASIQDTIGEHNRSLESRYEGSAAIPSERVPLVSGQLTGGPGAVEDTSPRIATFSTNVSDLGASTVHIQDDQLVAIKLADLISLFEGQLGRSLFVWLSSSDNASKFVTPASLRKAGIEAAFHPQSGQVVLSVPEE